MIDLGTLGGPQSFARAINGKQQVTGNASIDPCRNISLQAYLWENGFIAKLGTLPWAANEFSRGFAINDAGMNGQTRAFLLVPDCSAVDINNDDEFGVRRDS